MEISEGLSLVQSVVKVLGSPVWTRIEAALGLESQLDKLKETMSTIEAVFLDAEVEDRLQQSCRTFVERNRLQRLKEALYRADDLLDEIATHANRKKLMPCNKYKVFSEVCLFFSRSNQLKSAFTWSREVKDILEMLDDIVKDHRHNPGLKHPLGLDAKLMRISARETHSFVCDEDVFIGREVDKQKVVDSLLDSTVGQDAFVVSIVGIGGMGKTTLAKQVYNDVSIVKKFPHKMWVCVSDDFNVKALVGQILAAANAHIKQDGLSTDQLQMQLQQALDKKKYLLVLDDLWNEDPGKWHELRNLLAGGERVSRILVTTRSERVADVVGSCWKHELKGLSEEDSWILFQKMALKPEDYPMRSQFVDIGTKIVKKCANVPLAIRVVGSLLRGQDESKWKNVKKTDLTKIVLDEITGIIPVLKISYNYLPFHLKRCFSYCAVFPKDYNIIKDDLICLWMAQGFIMPSDGEGFEDAGEEYIKQLLQRCFFQDIERANGTNEIISCKMHDLIHDLAKEVAGTEILASNYGAQFFNGKTRHVYIDSSTPSPRGGVGNITKMKRLRTLLCDELPLSSRSPDVLLSKVKYLRVLSLNNIVLKVVPSVIGELFHLRYLDLSQDKSLLDTFFVLPSSITKLYNLQTLNLRRCTGLKRLPRYLLKLVNLRHLDISGCSSLTHMPPGMNNMTSLQKLTGFVVSGTSNARVGKLKDLENFTNHSGTMEIFVKKGVRYNEDASEARKGGFLLNSKKLREIEYYWEYCSVDEREEIINAEALLQGLQPHSNLRKLKLWHYPGMRFLTWGSSLLNCLPNLVTIEIVGCRRLTHLPSLSQLRYLKVLLLQCLHEVEYMESSSSSNNNGGDEEDESVFFPSLENLVLDDMPKLKGWWKSELGKDETQEAAMLSCLTICSCPKLTTFPYCPKLDKLKLMNFNEALGPIMRENTTHALISNNNNNNNNNNRQKNKVHYQEEGQQGRLRVVEIDNVAYLKFLPMYSFRHLSNLEFHDDKKTERLRIGEVGEVFRSGRLSTLHSLDIYCCSKLKSISGRGVWRHFTALETLTLQSLNELEFEDEDDHAKMPWRYLAPTLHSLELRLLRKVVKLPKGIGCLSSLQSLTIWSCKNFESLTPSIGSLSSLQSLSIDFCRKLKTMPEEMRHLTSLTQLKIWGCSPEIQNDCNNKNGSNWSNIKHIPHIIY